VGTAKDLTIVNSNTGAGTTSTIRFIGAATDNTVEYCKIQGSQTNAAGGVVFFSTAGTGNGNEGNIIDNNDITSSTTRPYNAIYSAGTTAKENSGITISNNNIYNFLNPGAASNGVNFATFSASCTIENNSFYETSSFASTAAVAYNVINVASGSGMVISGNSIGGSAPLCAGTWTKTGNKNHFTAINLATGTVSPSVQGNTIAGFSWTDSGTASWFGIGSDVVASIGDVTANTIGSSTVNSISLYMNDDINIVNSYSYGISTLAGSTVQGNTISGFTTATATTASNSYSFYGINITAAAGTTLVNNNTIANIDCSSKCINGQGQTLYGVYSAATGTATISGNTILYLINRSTSGAADNFESINGPGLVQGIYCLSGTNTISDNRISKLYIYNENPLLTSSVSVAGISLGSSDYVNTVRSNTISHLTNYCLVRGTTMSNPGGNIMGIFFNGNTGSNVISGNFIQRLSSVTLVYGIYLNSGNTTVSNNIISLSDDTCSVKYGIYDKADKVSNNTYLYHNTVYVGGTSNICEHTHNSFCTHNSYCLYSAGVTNKRYYRNNIFYNNRAVGENAINYAAYFAYSITDNLTLNNNSYYVKDLGVNTTLGYYADANKTTLPLVTGLDAGSLSVDPQFVSNGSITAAGYIPRNILLRGAAGTGITTDYAGVTRMVLPTMGAYEGNWVFPVEVWSLGIKQNGFDNLKLAFDAINAGMHTGALDIKINSSITQNVSAVLNASGTGSASYTSIHVYPTVTGLSINGNLTTPLIDLNGADNVNIDGRVNGVGTEKDMTIVNTSTSNTAGTSTIRFYNDAANNIVEYCTLKGSETAAVGGVVFFSTGTTVGNNNNTIDNNAITNAADAYRPLNAVYSSGLSAYPNSGIIISNNNIYNFMHRSTASFGVNFAANSTACTVSGNSFYETATFVPNLVAGNVLKVINVASGDGYTVSGNYIGGSAPQCSGIWTKTAVGANASISFSGIYLADGTNTPHSVQGNTIKGFVWSDIATTNWYGIYNAGRADIGTVSGNTIGSAMGTGSITFNSYNGILYGIYATGASVIKNNTLGSLTGTPTSSSATHIAGIYLSGAVSSMVSGNMIGSSTTAGSIQCSAGSQYAWLFGIYSTVTATTNIEGNVIQNLTNASTTNGSTVQGIYCSSGTNSIWGNIIHDFSIASARTGGGSTSAMVGVCLGASNYVNSVRANTIYNLSNTGSGDVMGLYFAGNTGANDISGNYIYGLSSGSGNLYGAYLSSGTTTVSNNILNLGGSNDIIIYGIFDPGLVANNNSYLYHNTVYIDGIPSASSKNSYCLYGVSAKNIRNYQNNIFNNGRSSSGSNYAAYLNYATATNLTMNNNDYYVSGTGGVLGNYLWVNKTTLPLVAGLDAGSLSLDPQFVLNGGTAATDYKPTSNLLLGATGTSIGTDYMNTTRAIYPAMGAWEVDCLNMWYGATSSDWNVADNWTKIKVPNLGDDIRFASSPQKHCVLDQDRVVNNITNAQSAYRLVTNGKKLTVTGSLSLGNGAKIDASSIGSTVEFAGLTAQSIPSGAFYNNAVYNLQTANANNVVLYGTVNLLNKLTCTAGLLDAISQTPSVVYAGTSKQRIESATYLNDQVYNLTIDNAVGVTDTCNLTVAKNLMINTGKLLTIAPTTNLTVNGTLTNNAGVGGLVINSTEKGTGSLNHSTDNIPATVKRFMKNTKNGTADGKHFLSSPVANQSIGGEWTPLGGTHTGGTSYDLYVMNEPTQTFVINLNNLSDPKWGTIHPQNYFVPGRGYTYALQTLLPLLPDTVTKKFVGNLNNGNVTYPVTAISSSSKRLNLVGNPYPSTIDWKADAGFDRSKLINYGGGYAVWIWNPIAKNYGAYNSADLTDDGTNGASRYIAPMQGFYVQAAAQGALIFKNSARSSSANNSIWRVSAASVNSPILSVKVNSNSNEGSDEVRYMFSKPVDEAGSMKLFSFVETAPSLYTKVAGLDYSTSYLADSVGSRVLPLEFKAGSTGDYTLECAYTSSEIRSLLLEDRLEKKVVDLTQPGSYSFKADASSNNSSRFVLYINKQVPDKIETGWNAKVYRASDKLIVDLTALVGNYSASVMDASGKVLVARKAITGGEKVDMGLLVHGVYVVTVSNYEETKVYKVVY